MEQNPNLSTTPQPQTFVVLTMDNLRSIMQECFAMCKYGENQEPAEELLTTEKVCELLHVDRSTLWRWNKDEYLCPIKVGKKNMYKACDVKNLQNV